ncbi:MAG: hypothetical protein WCZ08_01810 [Parcubacteria group bacterium]|jgi:hypothetical protein|nr:hypothetical protein [Candidatus Moranbacteria bacterium]MDX9855524.1 hypothetical protein [Candidatus Moranbacteria bacterium]
MIITPLEKHIRNIEKEKKKIFLEAIRFFYGNDRKLLNYYLLTATLSFAALIFSNWMDIGESPAFAIGNFLLAGVFVLSLAEYLNFVEKSEKKYKNIFSDLDLKYDQEISIFRDFYSGKIDENELRNFYLERENLLEKYFLSVERRDVAERWLIFIGLSLAVILIFLNF